MNNYPQDNFILAHHICTHTQKSKLTEKLQWEISGSVSDFTQSLFNQTFNSLSKRKFRSSGSGSALYLNLNPEVTTIHQSYFRNWKNFCFIHDLSPNLGLGIHVENSKDTLLFCFLRSTGKLTNEN